ncbi:hypothetical protein ACIP79_00685 [Streptomyces sp. NPDC088747]|uniref:hypothetical protein n=1 Tax=Streptomyces sp. NPDC088747 TaxID=3365886 RepID=UPI0037F940EB
MPYTIGEKLRIGWLIAKNAKQAAPHRGDPDAWTPDPRIDRELSRMERRKEERERADEQAMQTVLGRARHDVAAAKANIRTARGFAEKRTARDEEREAARELRRVEGAARRAGYRI